jgi:hypothetical protein
MGKQKNVDYIGLIAEYYRNLFFIFCATYTME